MQRIVLDTSILVAGLRSRRGASNALLRDVALGKLSPLVSVALFLEYEAVLKRPEQRLAHGMDIPTVDGFLAALASASVAVDLNFQWRPQLTDANDEMVLEVAVNGRAEALVTHNVKGFAVAARRFGLRVLRPRDMLEALRS